MFKENRKELEGNVARREFSWTERAIASLLVLYSYLGACPGKLPHIDFCFSATLMSEGMPEK